MQVNKKKGGQLKAESKVESKVGGVPPLYRLVTQPRNLKAERQPRSLSGVGGISRLLSKKKKKIRRKVRRRTTGAELRSPNQLTTQQFQLSPELASLLQTPVTTRCDAVRLIWKYATDHNLKNVPHQITCDDNLRRVFNVQQIEFHKLPSLLNPHFLGPAAPAAPDPVSDGTPNEWKNAQNSLLARRNSPPPLKATTPSTMLDQPDKTRATETAEQAKVSLDPPKAEEPTFAKAAAERQRSSTAASKKRPKISPDASPPISLVEEEEAGVVEFKLSLTEIKKESVIIHITGQGTAEACRNFAKEKRRVQFEIAVGVRSDGRLSGRPDSWHAVHTTQTNPGQLESGELYLKVQPENLQPSSYYKFAVWGKTENAKTEEKKREVPDFEMILMQREDIRLWSAEEVHLFAKSCCINTFAEQCLQCQVKGEELYKFCDEDLEALGIHAPFLKMRVKKALLALKKGAPSFNNENNK